MTANQTISIFILVTVYLVGLNFYLSAMAEDVAINYNSSNQALPSWSQSTFVGDIVISISELPLWMNTIFILIPVALWFMLLVLLLLHG